MGKKALIVGCVLDLFSAEAGNNQPAEEYIEHNKAQVHFDFISNDHGVLPVEMEKMGEVQVSYLTAFWAKQVAFKVRLHPACCHHYIM